MDAVDKYVIVASSREPAARCVVCGNEVAAGEGITARAGDSTLRFRCLGCLARFEADPERYLSDHATDCCRMDDAECSAMSEWTI